MEKPQKRDSTIDLLRGVSILLVLVHHFHLTYRIDRGLLAEIFPVDFLKRLGGNGNYGVTIFFVISGFLITSTTIARFGELKNVSLRSFYAFRFARIIPNIALMLCIVLILGWAGLEIFQNTPGTASMGATLLSILTFTHNVLMQKFGWFNYCLNTLWSLSVEEVFYFAFPLLCIFLRNQRLILCSWVAIIVIAPIYRARHLDNDIIALHDYLSCFDAIAMGCITAVAAKRLHLSLSLRYLSILASCGLIAVVYFYKGILANAVYGVSLVACSTAVILFSKSDTAFFNGRTSRVVCWFGKNSYELYLFHIIVLALMRTAVKQEDLGYYAKPLWFTFFITSSAFAAELISKFYSEPLNRKLRSFFAIRKADNSIKSINLIDRIFASNSVRRGR